MNITEQIEQMAREFTGKKFMGVPDHWYEPYHFWCDNGHRSRRYLKSERLGYNACLAGGCGLPVSIGPETIPGVEPK